MSLDWVIFATSIAGKFLAVKKLRATWLLSILSQIIWVKLCIDKDMPGLIALSFVHGAMAVWGFISWSRDDAEEQG